MQIVLVALGHTDKLTILNACCDNGGTRCIFLPEELSQMCYLLIKWNIKLYVFKWNITKLSIPVLKANRYICVFTKRYKS